MKPMVAKISICLVIAIAGVTVPYAQVDASKCDFSGYKTFTRSHFLPNGVVRSSVPAYPAAARAVRADGIVQVRILVDYTGKVREACALGGHPLLRPTAVQAAKKTKLKRNFGLSAKRPNRASKRTFLMDTIVFRFTL
jgi:hypothetical protein